MVNVLTSSVVDRGFEPQIGQIKDYKIVICCFSTKHAALRRKNKHCLARKQDIFTLYYKLQKILEIFILCQSYFPLLWIHYSLVEQEQLTLPEHLSSHGMQIS